MKGKRKIKAPSFSVEERFMDIRIRGKTEGSVTDEEHKLCTELYKKYPEWYSNMEPRVFNATVPFGSFVRVDEIVVEYERDSEPEE